MARADSRRYAESVAGSALGMKALVRQPDQFIGAARDFVQPVFKLRAQGLHCLVVSIGRHPDNLAGGNNSTPEWQMNDGAVPVIETLEPAVAIATGRIGRPDSRASMMMPSPALRATFGTSAVSAMLIFSSSVRSIILNAPTPPLR